MGIFYNGPFDDEEEDFDSDDDIYNVGWERERTSKINARNIHGELPDSAGQSDKTDNISISRADV